MPSKKLSAVAIPHLKEGEWYDQGVAGLILWVGKKRRSWYFRYHANGSYQRKPLGTFPAMELGAARDAARLLIDRADKGIPIEAPAPHPRSSDVLTLGGLFDRYETLRTKEGKRTKTLPEAMALMRRALKPWLTLPAAEFSKANLRAARDAMVENDAMIAGNRLLQRLGAVMKWAAQEDLIPHNFVPDIRKAPEKERTRKLTDAEIEEDLACLRGSRRPRGRAELRPPGAFSAGDGATPWRGRRAPPWSHSRLRVAADRQQVEPAA